MKCSLRHIILLFLLTLSFVVKAEEKESLDVKSFIFGHTSDSYCFHITEIHEKPVCVWLPVIVKCKDGGSWHCFSSKHICELKEGETFNHKGANFYISPIDRKSVV